MRRKCFCLAALCLMLAGCGPKEAQVTPAPSPSVTAEPTATPSPTPELTASPEPTATPAPWETGPNRYVMGWLDELLKGEALYFRFWIHPGSGPTPTKWPAQEYAQTIRALFEGLDWDSAKLLTSEEEEEENADLVDVPGAYSVTLNDEDWSGEGSFSFSLNSRVIRVNWGEGQLYFLVPGAETLCTQLTDLEPSVYVNLGRTRVPAQESQEATLKLYLETALERTRELGHITDYELRAYEVIPPENENGEDEEEVPLSMAYTATYAFKPAHPESAFWKDYDLESTDGWVVGSIEEHTEFLDYDERDGCYGMG